MRSFQLHVILFLLLTMLFGGCVQKEPTDELPPATMEGKNTFGALVNGEVWTGGCSGLIGLCYQLQYTPVSPSPDLCMVEVGAGVFYLQAPNGNIPIENWGTEWISLTTDSIFSEGSFKLDSVTCFFGLGDFAKTELGLDMLYTHIGEVNSLNITRFDTLEKIISGTFDLQLVSDSGTSVFITEGRFDMRYK